MKREQNMHWVEQRANAVDTSPHSCICICICIYLYLYLYFYLLFICVCICVLYLYLYLYLKRRVNREQKMHWTERRASAVDTSHGRGRGWRGQHEGHQ